MTVRHLRIFKTVCEELSLTGAAKKLYMTQPAVSHVIHDLEVSLGFRLFDRLSRKIYVSEAGKLFLQKTIRILELYDDLEENSCDFAGFAPLRVGSCITIANFWLPAALKQFQSDCSDAPINIKIDTAKAITELLLHNEIDIALIEGVVSNEQLISLPFSSYNIILVCSPSHPFALKESVDLEELAKEKLLLRERGSAIRDTADRVLMLHNMIADAAWNSVNSQALIQGVKHNLGVSLLPDILVNEELERGELTQIAIHNISMKNENHIVFHKDKYMSETMNHFISAVQSL